MTEHDNKGVEECLFCGFSETLKQLESLAQSEGIDLSEASKRSMLRLRSHREGGENTGVALSYSEALETAAGLCYVAIAVAGFEMQHENYGNAIVLYGEAMAQIGRAYAFMAIPAAANEMAGEKLRDIARKGAEAANAKHFEKMEYAIEWIRENRYSARSKNKLAECLAAKFDASVSTAHKWIDEHDQRAPKA